jgi:hypothetical protein
MSVFFPEKSVSINAPAAKIWRVFTDPAPSRRIGGEYVTDWKVGGGLGEDAYRDAEQGWDAALLAVKELAEK